MSLESQVTELTGEQVLAGALVLPRGYSTKRAVGAGVAGVAGMAVAGMLAGGIPESTPAGHRGMMYMAVTANRVAFFELKRGFIRNHLGRVLRQFAPSDVTSFEFTGKGFMAKPMSIGFADGTLYELETERRNRKKIEAVRSQLGR